MEIIMTGSDNEFEKNQYKKKKNVIILAVCLLSVFVITVTIVVLYNVINTQNAKNSIETEMNNKMWENAFDKTVQSDLSDADKKTYYKSLFPKMEKNAEYNRYNDFKIKKTCIYDEDNNLISVLKIDYKNKKDKIIYREQDSAVYEKSMYSEGKVWVSGTQDYFGSFIYGNGNILFAIDYQTKDGDSLYNEIVYYKYDIKRDNTTKLLTSDNDEYDTFKNFTKLKNGNIIIEEKDKTHMYNPYTDVFKENVDLTEKDKDKYIYYTFPNDFN